MLNESFSNIFRLALDPLASVMSFYASSRRVWGPCLWRDPNDWEVGEMVSLLGILGNINPNTNGNDRWIWRLDRKGQKGVLILNHSMKS